jgi:hypothetical protein
VIEAGEAVKWHDFADAVYPIDPGLIIFLK